MSGDERRSSIIESAIAVFALHGLAGTSTKDLALAAGISEALLYRHFASKDELHSAAHEYAASMAPRVPSTFLNLPASTATLVLFVCYVVRATVVGVADSPVPQAYLSRLIAMSLLDDGVFARDTFRIGAGALETSILTSWQAAKAARDVHGERVDPRIVLWLTQHSAFTMGLTLRQEKLPIDYLGDGIGVEPDSELIEAMMTQVQLLGLRGLGVSESAITRHFEPRKLARQVDRVLKRRE